MQKIGDTMAGITLEKGKKVYSYGQPLTALHMITAGKVQVAYPGGTYQLGKGDVIGVCEICSEIHFLDYTVLEEISILTYPLNSMSSLEDLMEKHPDVARLFLLSAFNQMITLQNRCALSGLSCSNLYQSLNEDYSKYMLLCNRYRITPRTIEGLAEFEAFIEDESPDLWMTGYYQGLVRIYAGENFKSFVQESAVSVGFLHKCSHDYHRTFSVLEEENQYQQQLCAYYFAENCNDLFDLYSSLYYRLGQDCDDSSEIFADINRMFLQFESDPCVNQELLMRRSRAFHNNVSMLTEPGADSAASDAGTVVMGQLAGSLNTILDFAGADLDIAGSFREHVNAYKALTVRSSMEEDVVALRKALTEEFYVLYAVVFERTLDALSIPMPAWLFLYFGYVDEELAGAENAVALYQLANSMTDRSEFGIYTFYHWLMAIFEGKKAPSRNEFEQDYTDYIHKQKLSGTITEAELNELESNAMGKVNYELRNMFPIVNKMTHGHVSDFCPLFCSESIVKDLNCSYVTTTQISRALEQIRKVDYTAFYRESLDHENLSTMGKEHIHLEFLPDIILMPNVGSRGVMWQEIESKHRNTPCRMVFSIFHLEALNTSLIRMTGEFRWELCKRMQGSRWNDASDHSLTSDYFDYIQFYRKNHDLSSEAKERVRSSLQRTKSSFKEMFIRDYIVWILFEGNGSPRLNKVARRILFTYCPFPADICETLAQNPLYAELINQRKAKIEQRLHHLDMLTRKFKNNNQAIPPSLTKERYYTDGIKG